MKPRNVKRNKRPLSVGVRNFPKAGRWKTTQEYVELFCKLNNFKL